MRPVLLALLVSLVLPAAAGAVTYDFLKCKRVAGKTMTDVEQVVTEWRALVDKAGYSDYKVAVLLPVHAEDISQGVFWWMGTAPDYARLGAAYNWWLTNADAAKMGDKFGTVFTCTNRSTATVAFSK
jgi:hypothetical protein